LARQRLNELKEKRQAEKDLKEQKKLDAQIKLWEERARYYASGGSTKKNRTWTVNGNTYHSITGAYVALPKQYRDWVDKTIYNSLHATDKEQLMEQAVEMYLQGVEVPVEAPASEEKETAKQTGVQTNANGQKIVTFS
jgi:hypothetical protein